METNLKYALSLRILHWLMAALILGLIALGWVMSELPREDTLRPLLVSLHKSFGITVLALALLRMALRLRTSVPPLPDVIPRLERQLAHLGHGTLYLLMLAVPVSGIIMSQSYGYPVAWFGLSLPRLLPINRELAHEAADVHEILPYLLLILVALHAGAVPLHYLKHRVNLLKRIL